jgi:glucose/arabinose dehydrogenase
MLVITGAVVLAVAGAVAACGARATQPLEASIGPSPALPAPHPTLLPTVNVATAKGWAAGATPVGALGLHVAALAQGLDHPRWLAVLPNNDVLVAETNAPTRPDDAKGVRGLVQRVLFSKAGADVPSANRITLLRDDGHGGVERHVFLKGLNSPFGMALVGGSLYVADTDALLRFPYRPGQTEITALGTKLCDLPGGPINHHWTKNVVASADGRALYVSVGSNSNAAENGLPAEEGRAAVWQVDAATGAHRVFAGGLRNPVGMAWQPQTGALWVAVNERDEIGSDLVPDYMTAVRDGAFYGWPFSYYGQHMDERVPAHPEMVARAVAPDYALGAHTASLGLAFSKAGSLPAALTEGAFVGQHGSWNRMPRSGYRVIFVPFAGGQPAGTPVEVLTGFLNGSGEAQGRPVGVAMDQNGALLVADDVGNTVWKVTGPYQAGTRSGSEVQATQ